MPSNHPTPPVGPGPTHPYRGMRVGSLGSGHSPVGCTCPSWPMGPEPASLPCPPFCPFVPHPRWVLGRRGIGKSFGWSCLAPSCQNLPPPGVLLGRVPGSLPSLGATTLRYVCTLSGSILSAMDCGLFLQWNRWATRRTATTFLQPRQLMLCQEAFLTHTPIGMFAASSPAQHDALVRLSLNSNPAHRVRYQSKLLYNANHCLCRDVLCCDPIQATWQSLLADAFLPSF